VRRSEFRLICATNRNIGEEISLDRFRKDLYFRINVFPIVIPPLRERPEDIPGLVSNILRNLDAFHVDISPEVMQLLMLYPWPGNIRELKNVLERAILLARGQPLTPEHFSGLEVSGIPQNAKDTCKLADIQESHLRNVIKRFDGDTRKAAEALGISRATLYRKIQRAKNKR